MAFAREAGGLVIGAALMLTGIGLLLLFMKQFLGGFEGPGAPGAPGTPLSDPTEEAEAIRLAAYVQDPAFLLTGLNPCGFLDSIIAQGVPRASRIAGRAKVIVGCL